MTLRGKAPRFVEEAGRLGRREDLLYSPEAFVDIVFGKTVADAEIAIHPEVISWHNVGILFIDQAPHDLGRVGLAMIANERYRRRIGRR